MYDNTLQQLAEDIVKHDPKLFGTLTEMHFGPSNEYKLERILDWSMQWENLAPKHTTGKRQQGRS